LGGGGNGIPGREVAMVVPGSNSEAMKKKEKGEKKVEHVTPERNG